MAPFVPAPRESNFRNTSSSRGSRTQELRRPKTVHMYIYHTIGMITPVYIHCIIIIQWQDCMANWVTPADHASPVASFPIGLGRLAPCWGVGFGPVSALRCADHHGVSMGNHVQGKQKSVALSPPRSKSGLWTLWHNMHPTGWLSVVQ